MKLFTAALFATAGVATTLATPALAALTAPVRIETGLVTGAPTGSAEVTAFRGIPYAAPPVGELRWRAPRPAPAWKGVRAAEKPGPICPQPTSQGNAGREMDEDCLNLDVWTGASRSGERRPVMVWFHGGERGFGAGSSPNFDGNFLAQKGTVVVTVNYRGGPLGLLATDELSKESPLHVSGNYLLLDDIAALKWVQRNIAAFGGDPKNVTIFGQSWGAATVHFLSVSPLARGLFQRMITQSHARYARDPDLFAVSSRYMPLPAAEADGAKYMQFAGVKTLAELRRLPWPALIDAYRKSTSELVWTFVLDGHVMPRTLADTYGAAAQADVTVIAGANLDESGAAPETAFDLVASGKARRPDTAAFQGPGRYTASARQKYGAMSDEFLRLYPAASERDAFSAASTVIRDNNRISPWMWASAFTAKRNKAAYLYHFTHAPPGPNHDLTGVFHGAEIGYVFNHPATAWSDEDRRIADLMSSYWVNFARTGNPNGPGLPAWPAFDRGSDQIMELGDHFATIPLGDKAKVDFWRRFYATQPPR